VALYFVVMVINLFLSRINVSCQSLELSIGKGYESRGLFHLSLCENNVKCVNHINNHDEANIWHSRLCHINFGCMSRLVGLN
jgi:hypothetical protein